MVFFSLSWSRPPSFRCAGQIDRAQVAHGDLVVVGVQGDLGAQVGAVHHAHVLVGVAHVAGILEGDPGMAGLEQHGQHLAPQAQGGHLLEHLDLAARGLLFVARVGGFERLAEQVVQVRAVGRAENSVHSAFSITRFMNRSGTQLAVFMSWVRRRSSPVFLRSSRNSSMSMCQVSRKAHTAPLRLPPWLTATAVSLATFRNGTTPCDLPLVPLM